MSRYYLMLEFTVTLARFRTYLGGRNPAHRITLQTKQQYIFGGATCLRCQIGRVDIN